MSALELNENTPIPAKLLWSMLVVAVGGAVWLTTMFVRQQVAATRLEELGARVEVLDSDRLKKRDEFTELLHRIDNRLSRIEGKLNVHQNTK